MVLLKRLAQQLEAIVELDNSLGVEYCSLPGGISSLELGESGRLAVEEESAVEAHNSAVDERAYSGLSYQNYQGKSPAVISSAGKPELLLSGSAEKIRQLEELSTRISDCVGCVLSQGRRLAVCGEGFVDADIAFVASAPGREEDNRGRNFQGAAGQLLTDIIEKGMKIPREGVYLTSIVKCRPPGNRSLFEIEIDACRSYFAEEIKIVAPKFIIAVGGAAANILTRQQSPIEQLRGIWYEYAGIPLMPIYHPSFLLRQRRKLGHSNEFVRQTWQDIKQVLGRLGQG